ncbi:MAG: FAD-binding oxidoreductase [Tatlockia sp.]|nr:FAD-binding oxidoreductase [Tatlockia sp.]
MPQTHWSTQQIKLCNKETGQAMLSDEHLLVSYSQDFGKILRSDPAAFCRPETPEKIQTILNFTHQNDLALTIRAKGLSQGGQALALNGGLTLHLEQLSKVLDKEPQAIWVEANCTWSQLLDLSLKSSQIPYVLPYNCNLSIAGVISAGGVGASSFKFGPITAHIKALEVVLANGEIRIVDENSPLFHACLSGQGRFAVITKACIKLRPCAKQVRSFFLSYLNKAQWLNDLDEFKRKADYIEAFCSPSIQGAKLVAGKRVPFAQWLFAIHVSFEYDQTPPEFSTQFKDFKPWKILHQQDELIHTFLLRHDSRFEAMKLSGQWDLVHPWYECFIPKVILEAILDELLAELPLFFASTLQVVQLANKQQNGFLMLPDLENVYSLMIMNPGINPIFLPGCLEIIENLDKKLLKLGGKRYLSGYLGSNLCESYWQSHFGSLYKDWVGLKAIYDERHIFGSVLHNNSSSTY